MAEFEPNIDVIELSNHLGNVEKQIDKLGEKAEEYISDFFSSLNKKVNNSASYVVEAGVRLDPKILEVLPSVINEHLGGGYFTLNLLKEGGSIRFEIENERDDGVYITFETDENDTFSDYKFTFRPVTDRLVNGIGPLQENKSIRAILAATLLSICAPVLESKQPKIAVTEYKYLN